MDSSRNQFTTAAAECEKKTGAESNKRRPLEYVFGRIVILAAATHACQALIFAIPRLGVASFSGIVAFHSFHHTPPI
jgi:hypothetical protein